MWKRLTLDHAPEVLLLHGEGVTPVVSLDDTIDDRWELWYTQYSTTCAASNNTTTPIVFDDNYEYEIEAICMQLDASTDAADALNFAYFILSLGQAAAQPHVMLEGAVVRTAMALTATNFFEFTLPNKTANAFWGSTGFFRLRKQNNRGIIGFQSKWTMGATAGTRTIYVSICGRRRKLHTPYD